MCKRASRVQIEYEPVRTNKRVSHTVRHVWRYTLSGVVAATIHNAYQLLCLCDRVETVQDIYTPVLLFEYKPLQTVKRILNRFTVIV